MWWLIIGFLGSQTFGILGMVVGIFIGLYIDDSIQEIHYNRSRR